MRREPLVPNLDLALEFEPTVRATVEMLRLPLADAKRLVHESHAWADRREQADQWHDALIAELEAEASRRPT